MSLPETILQFGAGNFLRAFADLFIAEANRGANPPGRVVVVQSTGIERAEAINRAGGCYHVAVRGVQDGEVVDETVVVDSISRALHAGTQWDEVLAFAAAPDLKWILSNTTEAGFTLNDADAVRGDDAPVSFPAKLLAVLLARYEAGQAGVIVLPCELIENNGGRLLELVKQQAARWSVEEAALNWITDECRWLNNLVDRIVPGPPPEHPLLGEDPLLLAAEPFAFWAIEDPRGCGFEHPAITATNDISSYYLRKVRILNGAHSALVCRALPLGIETVREAVEHPEVGPWLERLLSEEIVPVLEGRCEDPAGFARATLDRFRNPFFEHRLSAIALNHEAKVAVRLLPTLADYRERFGREPELLSSILS
ncbi:tagaturonate reductase [Luteolibacter sp. LG18]|uniref:tagaturonate reductase n=1 Tax=Luteolibacter sp. LG18 TaxID=2819286 RepID=UPI002B306B11|nr:altronate oxidoreductase [Luteolibacter sp. LG18]